MANNNDDNSSSNSNTKNLQRLLAAALSRAEAAERALEDAERAIAVERQAAAADREAREAAERAGERTERLNNGTYYSTLNQVWGALSVPFTPTHFYALLRTDCPMVVDDTSYAATNAALINVNNLPADESKASRSTLLTNQRISNWPSDIFGNRDTTADIAHLIPASAANAKMYDDVAMLAMGLTRTRLARERGREPTPEEYWDAKQTAIHGGRPAIGQRRINNSGLKHSNLNKLRLRDQKGFFDTSPCILIVPIMSLDEMVNWSGQPYDALVMLEQWDSDSVETVCRTIGMNKQGPVATEAEIELACQLLSNVLRGLAFSFTNRERPVERSFGNLSAHRSHVINALGEVTVPTAAINDHVRRVRKVRFGAPGGHMAPDPLLLAVKAAVAWSERYEQQLLAKGEVDDDISSLGQPTVDMQFADVQEKMFGGSAHSELEIAFCQPNGCHLDDADDGPTDFSSLSDDDDADDSVPEIMVVKSDFLNTAHHNGNGMKSS